MDVRQTRWLIVLGIVLASLGLGAWVVLSRTTGTPPGAVRITRGVINATVEAVGRVRPTRQAQLSLRYSGRVTDVLVQPGDRVDAGQVLIKVDPSQLERDLRQAELELTARRQRLSQAQAGASPAEVEAAQAAVREALVAREVAQARYDDRTKSAGASTSSEAATLEAAKAAYQRARANLERALSGASPEELATLQTSVQQAELSVQAARTRLAETQLTAPFPGVVLEVNTRPDENIGGQSLVLLADVSTLHVEADVDEIDAPSVQAGQTAEIRFDAFPAELVKATVTRVAPAASTQRGAVSYTAWLDLAATDLQLKPGMGATVRIATRTKTDALLAPVRAVQNVGRQKIVRVLRGGRMTEVEVTTGLTDKQMVEITSGLQEGDVVVVD